MMTAVSQRSANKNVFAPSKDLITRLDVILAKSIRLALSYFPVRNNVYPTCDECSSFLLKSRPNRL